MYDETHVEDIDTDMEDHAYDDLRYMCQSKPIAPKLAAKDIKLEDDPLNQRIKKKRSIYVGHNI